MEVFTLDNYPLLASAAVTYLLAYLQYFYCVGLIIRERKDPFPVWMHTLYFAHDTTWTVRLLFAASQNNWNWFLVTAAVTLLLWIGLESFSLYKGVVEDRQNLWGPYSQGKTVTMGEAVGSTVTLIAACYTLVNILIEFMGQDSLFECFAFAIILMAAGPGELWRRRRSREGTSVGLAISILVAIIFASLPTGMFVLALPEVFNTTWFYAAGVVFSVISLNNLRFVISLPPKKQSRNAPKPIW